jgi:hypothetical protein
LSNGTLPKTFSATISTNYPFLILITKLNLYYAFFYHDIKISQMGGEPARKVQLVQTMLRSTVVLKIWMRRKVGIVQSRSTFYRNQMEPGEYDDQQDQHKKAEDQAKSTADLEEDVSCCFCCLSCLMESVLGLSLYNNLIKIGS